MDFWQKKLILTGKAAMWVKNEDSSLDISIIESQIDKLVYELYNLTDDEIAIVENN